jgi:hypothetical protein
VGIVLVLVICRYRALKRVGIVVCIRFMVRMSLMSVYFCMYNESEPPKMPNEVIVPEEVTMAKQLITLLCNFTDESFDMKDVHSNLIEMAEALSDDDVGEWSPHI